MKVKEVIAVLTAAMMLSSGCGKKDTKVDDYGDSSKESAVSDSQFEESDAKLSEKLGGDTLDYTNNFSLNGRNAKLDLSFSVPDIESVPVYKATSVQEAELKEDEIVKNLLGDTAKTLNTSDRDQFKDPSLSFLTASFENADKDHDCKKCYSRACNVFFSK